MAAIGEIRKRSGLVIILIGVAIVAFVLSDLLKSNQSLFRDSPQNAIGVVNGENITHEEFRQRVQQTKQNFQQQRGMQEISDRMMSTIHDRAWDQLVFDRIFMKEQEALNMKVSEKEMFNLIRGDNPHPTVKQAFRDPKTGEFNREQLAQLQQQLKRGPGGQASERQRQQFQRQKKQWINFERRLKEQREKEKFFNLIEKSFYATSLEANHQFQSENQVASIDYLALTNQQVPDTAVNVTDEALKAYYNDHKSNYKTEGNRSFEYVIFDITPTKKDSASIRESMKDLKNEFARRDRDSSFVELQSSEPFDTSYLSPDEIPEAVTDSVLMGEVGEVYGPYLGQNGYEVTKVIDDTTSEKTFYKASHILIKPEGDTDADTADARSKAKGIYNEIQGGADFEAMASEHNQDPAAGSDGDLGWFSENKMVEPFIEGVKGREEGDLFTVSTKFGTHIVKMTANPVSKKYQLGQVVRKIFPSESTYESVYNEASKFRSSVTSPSEFENAVRKAGLNKRVAEDIEPSKRFMPGLENAAELVNWAYSNKEGSLSGILELSDQYVIAHLTDVTKQGVQPLDEVRGEIRAEVLEEKKRERLIQKLNTANQGKGDDLDQIAAELDKEVKSASNIKFNSPRVSGFGNSEAIVGTAFGLKENMVSQPFSGDNGAYQIKLTSLQSVETPERLVSVKEEIQSNRSTGVQSQVVEALKDIADIQDMRYKF